jgi:hypothetical protein
MVIAYSSIVQILTDNIVHFYLTFLEIGAEALERLKEKGEHQF